jgi:hypothetical protein
MLKEEETIIAMQCFWCSPQNWNTPHSQTLASQLCDIINKFNSRLDRCADLLRNNRAIKAIIFANKHTPIIESVSKINFYRLNKCWEISKKHSLQVPTVLPFDIRELTDLSEKQYTQDQSGLEQSESLRKKPQIVQSTNNGTNQTKYTINQESYRQSQQKSNYTPLSVQSAIPSNNSNFKLLALGALMIICILGLLAYQFNLFSPGNDKNPDSLEIQETAILDLNDNQENDQQSNDDKTETIEEPFKRPTKEQIIKKFAQDIKLNSTSKKTKNNSKAQPPSTEEESPKKKLQKSKNNFWKNWGKEMEQLKADNKFDNGTATEFKISGLYNVKKR